MIDNNRKVGGIKMGARHLALVLLSFFVLVSARPVTAVTPGQTALDPVLVQDLRAEEKDSSPAGLVAIGSTVFFSANDGLTGVELWRTSPPYNSIQPVTDVCRGGCGSDPSSMTALGSTLFFSATDNQHGYELWRSEPPYTPATTSLVADINPDGDSSPAEIIPIGDAVFFTADDGQHGREIFRSSPPYNSAVLVKDIFPGNAGSAPHDLTRIGWMLFFAADDSTGSELWRSDPPYSGLSTFRLTDINPDGSANILEITPIDLKLFFSATDGSTGQELYMVESPYKEASRVTDIAGKSTSSSPHNLVALGETLFFSANIGTSGVELYRSLPPYDPTTTTLVEDINPGFFSSNPENKFAMGSTLFFSADNGKLGVELWKTDPRYLPSTTDIVLDINHGSASSNPTAFVSVGTTLFFTANDGIYGAELWKSVPPYEDISTEIVVDLLGGGGSSDPHSPLVVDNTLFFAASHAEYGKELFRYGGYYGMPNTGFAPGRVSAISAQPAAKAYRSTDGLTLDIPRLRASLPVVGVPAASDGWDLSWLTQQAGYLSGTAYPTWAGNTVLTSHAYLPDGTPGPFANLAQMQYGDAIYLDAYGQRYRYEVRSVTQIDADDTQAVFQHEKLDWLTLVTCKDYDSRSDSYLRRVVVRAVLVKVEAGK